MLAEEFSSSHRLSVYDVNIRVNDVFAPLRHDVQQDDYEGEEVEVKRVVE